ncbi:hypothetical protein ABK040_006673 [Willaertia magna]
MSREKHANEYQQYLSFREYNICSDIKINNNDKNNDGETLAHYLNIPNDKKDKEIANQIKFIHDLLHEEGINLTDKQIKLKYLSYLEEKYQKGISPKDVFIKSNHPYHFLYKFYFSKIEDKHQRDDTIVSLHHLNKLLLFTIAVSIPLTLKYFISKRVFINVSKVMRSKSI